MMLADLTVNTETMAVISLVVGGLTGVIGMLFRLYVAQVKEERDTWKKLADGAVSNLEYAANVQRKKAGMSPLTELAPVVPEHSSPTSKRQEETAEMATMRARLTAAVLSLGLEPRKVEGEKQ